MTKTNPVWIFCALTNPLVWAAAAVAFLLLLALALACLIALGLFLACCLVYLAYQYIVDDIAPRFRRPAASPQPTVELAAEILEEEAPPVQVEVEVLPTPAPAAANLAAPTVAQTKKPKAKAKPYAKLTTCQLVKLCQERGVRANARWKRETLLSKLSS